MTKIALLLFALLLSISCALKKMNSRTKSPPQNAPNKFHVLPAGESLIWVLAKQSGKYDSMLRYPAEDERYEKEKMDALGL